jgi:multidrug efflux pump subunit AcrA (membrane-fusion protein)
VLVAVAAVGLYLAIAGRRKPEAKYRTTPVDRGNITQTVTASGALSAVTTVQVGSQVSGIIAKLHADFNSKVKKGDLLAELDPTPFQAQVEHSARIRRRSWTRNSEITFNCQKRRTKARGPVRLRRGQSGSTPPRRK